MHTLLLRKSGVVRRPNSSLLQGVCRDLVQGDGEEDEGTTESTGDGGVMMGGPTRQRRHRKGRHYDAEDDVILRLEALQPQEVKVHPHDEEGLLIVLEGRACMVRFGVPPSAYANVPWHVSIRAATDAVQ